MPRRTLTVLEIAPDFPEKAIQAELFSSDSLPEDPRLRFLMDKLDLDNLSVIRSSPKEISPDNEHHILYNFSENTDRLELITALKDGSISYHIVDGLHRKALDEGEFSARCIFTGEIHKFDKHVIIWVYDGTRQSRKDYYYLTGHAYEFRPYLSQSVLDRMESNVEILTCGL